jgi:DNA-binding NarL/FixJ family response regulator
MPTLLIIDDHELFLEGAQLIFSMHQSDFSVVSASTPEEASRVLAERPVDLILVDLDLRDTDGLQFMQNDVLSKQLVPFAVMTANRDVHSIHRARSAGALGYILKECAGKQMVTAVRRLLEGDSVWPEVENPADEAELSDRQIDVIRLLASGYSNKHIAQHLNVTPETIKSHLKIIFRKLHVSNRAECVSKVVSLNLV